MNISLLFFFILVIRTSFETRGGVIHLTRWRVYQGFFDARTQLGKENSEFFSSLFTAKSITRATTRSRATVTVFFVRANFQSSKLLWAKRWNVFLRNSGTFELFLYFFFFLPWQRADLLHIQFNSMFLNSIYELTFNFDPRPFLKLKELLYYNPHRWTFEAEAEVIMKLVRWLIKRGTLWPSPFLLFTGASRVVQNELPLMSSFAAQATEAA